MNVLITGAQFNNKGAQSLLFSVINELRTRYDNIEIYYLPIDNCFAYSSKNFRFKLVYDDLAWHDCIRVKNYLASNLIRCLKDDVKWVIHRKEIGLLRLSKVWESVDAVIDVSGYALTSKFEIRGTHRYVRHINMAKKRGIPVILMPQSFGPFDYDNSLRKQVRKALESVDLIFARENSGKSDLIELGVDNNVRISPDLVLQSSRPHMENIFIDAPTLNVPKISTEENIGIIPNMQLYRYGNKENIIKIYSIIINALIDKEKNVYIFRHSNDLEACEDIYNLFQSNDKVHIIREELNCIEYGEFVKNFEFIIASRYHSIVHAYREYVPAFVIGWAVKYNDLAATLCQTQYVFDISGLDDTTYQEMLERLKQMLMHWQDEKNTILELMKSIRTDTCYNECFSILDRIEGKEK